MKPRALFVIGLAAAFVLSSCGTIDFNSLIAVLDDNGALDTISKCPQTPHASALMEAPLVATRIINVNNILPDSLKSDVVVRAILSQAQTVTAKASVALMPAAATAEAVAPVVSPPAPLSQSDFFKFARLVAEYVLRQPNSTPGMSDSFAQAVGQYYDAYFNGKFDTYFGASFAQPTVSMTVSDNEITQAAMVFVEYLFDQVLGSPVWYSTTTASGKTTNTYYPGNNSNEPTVAVLKYQTPVKIPDGCMTVTKAKLINDVAQQFATAASADSALTIKSVGGVEIGLGILGKLSIGDNSTLSNLVKNVASEVVLRLSAQLAYTVLKPYYIPDSSPTSNVVMARVASGAPPPRPTTAQTVRALFVSPNLH